MCYNMIGAMLELALRAARHRWELHDNRLERSVSRERFELTHERGALQL